MIYEIAYIEVKPGSEALFEQGYRAARPLFLRAQGCSGVELRRCVEKPLAYRLLVQWDSVESHMVTFRNSPDFQEWRRLVSDHFAAPPTVEHLAPL